MVEHEYQLQTNDLGKVQWVELNEDGTSRKVAYCTVLQAFRHQMDGCEGDVKKPQLIGKKLGESLIVDYRDFSENDADLAAMLAVHQR
jgi:hypothetical protein